MRGVLTYRPSFGNYIKYQISKNMTHRQLHNVVSEQLRQAILDGQFKPGEWLRQMKIAEELGVSQMPVREALKELAAEGLVEHVPYRGVRVIAFSLEDVADLYTHRSILEGMAAGAAAEKMSQTTLERLHHLQEQMQNHLEPTQLVEYRQLNREFHQIIYQASGRAYLIRTLDQMWSAFPTMLWGNFAQTAEQTFTERDNYDIQEHWAILEALRQQDKARAEAAMKTHIASAGVQFVQSLRQGVSP